MFRTKHRRDHDRSNTTALEMLRAAVNFPQVDAEGVELTTTALIMVVGCLGVAGLPMGYDARDFLETARLFMRRNLRIQLDLHSVPHLRRAPPRIFFS